jgi:hypothetical protein
VTIDLGARGAIDARRASVAVLLALVSVALPVRAEEGSPPVTIRTPRPGDGFGDRVSIDGACAAPGRMVRVELLDGAGRPLASASVPCEGSARAGRYRASLAPAPSPTTLTGRVRASIAGAPSAPATAEVAAPVVYLRPLRALTQELAVALAAGDPAPLVAHASAAYVEIAVPGRPRGPGGPPTPAALDPLVAWARREAPLAVRRTTTISNRHGDGYQVVVLELRGGFLSVGWECADALAGRAPPRVTKVLATREPVRWD